MTLQMPTLSLFFFASTDSGRTPDRYGTIVDAAVLAERLGFTAVWIPERHFDRFGGLFPNPAVLAAALAVRTKHIALRAGSVVLPLHHVARVAEEWAMVDSLSNGRVGLSLASGWNRGDFVLGECDYAQRREHLLAGIATLQELWRGNEVEFEGRGQTQRIQTYPVPMRPSLPLWLTATSGPATFLEAGRRGLRVLTAFLQQSPEQLAENIREYRQLFVAPTPDHRPHVTLMVHACVAETSGQAIAAVEQPLVAYQSEFLDLTDRRHHRPGETLTVDEKRELARYSARKYATERGLIGGPAEVADRLRQLASIGVDEVACLVDFGLSPAQITETLTRLSVNLVAATPAADSTPAR